MSDDSDWLSDLVKKPEDEAPAPVVSEAYADPLDDLRGGMVAFDAEPAVSSARSRSQRSIGGMLPWQVFFLSVMMFLDVAVVGLLFLVMLGRVVIP